MPVELSKTKPSSHQKEHMQKSRILPTAIVGLSGAIIGSFSMMLFASTHFAGVAGPGNTPPQVVAANIPSGAG